MTPASIIPVFGSQRPYADLNFAAGSFGLNGTSVSSLALLAGFTFTRASLAMMFDATGKLTYGPNNLCLQSGALQTTPWGTTNATVTANATAAPDGTVTAAKVVPTNATTGGRTDQSITLVAGTTYRISIYAKAAEWGWLRLRSNIDAAANVYFNLNTGVVGTVETGWSNATITSVGNGWYRCSASYVPGSTGFSLRPLPNNADNAFSTGDGTSGIYLWGAQLEAVTYQTTPSTYYPTTTAAYYGPRLVYDPVTLASQGILVEEARTNLCLQSQDFATTWSTDATVTTNATTSPDGTVNADLVTSVGSNTCVQSVVLAATSCAYSIFAKKSTGASDANRFYLRNATTATNLLGISIDYDTGALTYLIGSAGATATNVGNGWWRIALTVSAGITSGDTMTLYAGFVGVPTAGQAAYFWQAQLEAGTGASSPIPTTTASVTRAADVAAVTGLSVPAPLSLVSSGGMTNATATTRYMAQVDAGSSANIVLNYLNTANLRRCFVQTASVTQADIAVSSAVAVGDQWTIASRFQTDNVRPSTAGVLGTADTSATMPAGLANLRIGTDGTGGQFNGTISRIRIFNRALSDAQLQSLTS